MTEPESAPRYETLTVDEITPDPSNARMHSQRNLDAIAGSLRAFGQQKPIVVDSRGVVLAGNGTLAAAKALGWETVEVVRSDLSPPEAVAYGIADNRSAELAEWNPDLLPRLLEGLNDEMREVVDFPEDELVELAAEAQGGEVIEVDEVETPEVDEVETVTEPGDLWILGEHRLLCGDSTKAESWERLMGGEKADLIVTDPPYGIAYRTAGDGKSYKRPDEGKDLANDNLGDEGTRSLIAQAFAAVPLRGGAAFYVFCAPSFQTSVYLGLEDASLHARHHIVWVKDRLVLGRCDYHYRHEACWYGWAEGSAHQFLGGRDQSTVWEFARPGASPDHPTTKPIDLMSRPIQNSSREGEIVVDAFLGSGTTMMACEQLGRRCFGLELDPRYCDVIVRRWEELTGEEAERDGSLG